MILISEESIDGVQIRRYETINGNIIEEKGTPSVDLTTLPEEVKPENQPSLEEIQTQVLLNTEYLVVMSELTNI